MNNVTLVGNLAKDVYFQDTDDKKLAKFTLAVDTNKDRTDFIPVTVFGDLAEACSKYLRKGRKASIVGSVWTNTVEEDGEYTNYVNVVARNVKFLDKKPQDSKES